MLARAARRLSAKPPGWAHRSGGSSGHRHGQRHRHHRRPPPGRTTDVIGMAIPEAHLRARGISSARFDAEVAAATSRLLGVMDSGDGEAVAASQALDDENFGANLDRRYIHYQGKANEAARLAAGAAASNSLRGAEEGTHITRDGPPERTVMRSHVGTLSSLHSSRDGKPLGGGREPVAYVRSANPTGPRTGKPESPGRSADGEEGRRTVELDGGETLSMPGDRYAALRRTLRSAGGNSAFESLLGHPASTGLVDEGAAAAAEGERSRVTRQLRKEERRDGLRYGATRHPCLLQGAGCCATGHAHQHHHHHHRHTVCPLRDYPAVCCVEQLQTGSCEAARSGRCPWHHGEVGRFSAQAMLAESLFAREGVEEKAEEELAARLSREVPKVQAVLQLFVDLVVAAFEDGEVDPSHAVGHPPESDPRLSGSSFLTAKDAQERWGVLSEALGRQEAASTAVNNNHNSNSNGDGAGLLRLHTDAAGERMLVVEAGLALEAAAGAVAVRTRATHDDNHAAEDLEAMWAEAEAEERDGVWGDTLQTAVAAAPSRFLTSTKTLWTSFFISADDAELRLSPLLTDFLLDHAAKVLAGGGHDEAGADDLLWGAMRRLIQRRLAECEAFLAAQETGVAGGSMMHGETRRGAVGRCPRHLRWAPLLLLRDLVMLQRLVEEDSQRQQPKAGLDDSDAAPPLMDTFLEREGEGGHRAWSATPPSPPPPRPSHTLLLRAITAAAMGGDSAASHHHHHHASPRPTPNAALRARLSEDWAALHKVLLTVCTGLLRAEPVLLLLRDDGGPGAMTRAVKDVHQRQQHPLSLLSFVQTALVSLVLEGSRAIGALYEPALLESAGWQPWTDAQMFSSYQSAVYTPQRYARHHLPLLAVSCEASLLNAMLLSATQHVEHIHALSRPGPLSDTLDTPTSAAAVVPWLRAREVRASKAFAASLRRCVPVAMVFLAALQDLGQSVTAEQTALQHEFRARREAYTKEADEQSRSLHTRKYKGTTAPNTAAAASEALTTPLLDRVLPYGTVAVSAAATASLVRLLLESGKPYKALRLGVSIARVTRALRHAARQPLPRLVEGERTVHKMYREAKTNRKRVVKVRVPTLRLVAGGDGSGEAEEAGEGTSPAAMAATAPVGLLYQVDERVVEEMVRAGLRMGPAGAKLADGVRDDCVRGHVADFTQSRCLPAPTPQDASDAVRVRGSSSTVARPRDPSALLLRLRGLGQDSLRNAASLPASRAEDPQMVYPHRRVAPTALLLEILVTHTDPADSTRHQRYNRLLTTDPARFATEAVLLARQCALCMHRHQWALQAKECAWVAAARTMAQAATALSPSSGAGGGGMLPEWRDLWHEAMADKELVDEWGAPPSLDSLAHGGGSSRGLRGGKAPPITTEELKSILRGQDGEASGLESGEDRGDPNGDNNNGGASLSGKERRRQRQLARNPLSLYRPEALVTHLMATVPAPNGSLAHVQQQLRLLWCTCAGALVGLPVDALGGTHLTSRLAGSVLFQAILASAELDRMAALADTSHRVDWHHRPWTERLCQLLLLSRVWQRRSADTSLGKESATEGFPPLAPSTMAPVVDMEAFLSLQVGLGQRTGLGADAASPVAETLQALAFLAEGAGGAQDVDAGGTALSPVSALFAPISSLSPGVVRQWLETTLLDPSPAMLSWLVAHLDRSDAASLTATHQWLRVLAGKRCEPATVFSPVVAEHLLLHRQRPSR